MTENEAKAVRFIENIKSHAMVTLDHIAKEEPNVSPLVYKGREEKADTILAMVEELKQYRAIGTPEDLETMKEHGSFTGVELANIAAMQMKLKEYEAIGTLEECLRNKDFLDFLAGKMNPGDFETYLRLYNALEEGE